MKATAQTSLTSCNTWVQGYTNPNLRMKNVTLYVVVLPQGVNPIAVNKYINISIKMSSWILDLIHTVLSLTGPL
jgi:hypothetical protein